ESLMLAVIAGAVGLAIAVAGIRVILAIKPGELARLNDVSLDPRVLGWSVVVCLLTGILVGLAPALTATRRSLMPSGQEGGWHMSGGRAARRIRRALVVTEFALAIVLLVGAGLLIRSLWSVQNVDPGFRPERVLSMQLSTPASRSPAERADVYNRMVEQIATLPG